MSNSKLVTTLLRTMEAEDRSYLKWKSASRALNVLHLRFYDETTYNRYSPRLRRKISLLDKRVEYRALLWRELRSAREDLCKEIAHRGDVIDWDEGEGHDH